MKDSKNRSNILTAFIAINTIIFLVLSTLHFYWAFGGRLWYEDVLPSNSSGSKTLTPGMMATFLVAFGLLLLVIITMGNSGTWDRYIKRKYFAYSALLISVIFFFRAIGDFKFIGFFKTIKGTRFAVNDTQFFSPLCLFIALISLLIFLVNKPVRSGLRSQ